MMTLDDVGNVLAKVAAFDQRTIGAGDVLAWHEILEPYELADCLAAVTTHYREQRDRATVADIRKLAIGIRDQRQARQRQADGRLELDAAPTRDRSDDVKALVASVVAALPQPDVHKRALDRARRERGRVQPPPPKVKRSPKRPLDYPKPADNAIAALATRYLVDGYQPDAVSALLGVSARWCHRTAATLRPQPVDNGAAGLTTTHQEQT